MRLHGEDDAYQERLQAEQRAAAEERERTMASILAAAKPVVAAAAPAPVQLVPIANTGTAPRKTPAPEAVNWDDESVRAAVGNDFSAAVYFRDHPDVAADPWASANPERHWLAYGMAKGYAFPMPEAPAPSVEVKTVYTVPPLPSVPAGLFPVPAPAAAPAAQVQPVAQPVPQSFPLIAQPLTGPALQTLAPGASLPAASTPAPARPAWVIPAAIAAAAGAAALLLIRKPRRAR